MLHLTHRTVHDFLHFIDKMYKFPLLFADHFVIIVANSKGNFSFACKVCSHRILLFPGGQFNALPCGVLCIQGYGPPEEMACFCER